MITYLKGDATQPVGGGPKIIAHVCNDAGGWGAGFVLALSRRWKEPEAEYRAWHRDGKLELGRVRFVPVGEDIFVANMIAQYGYGLSKSDLHRKMGDVSVPLRYDALTLCLEDVDAMASHLGASVHMPRIGCGLAGGTWDRVGPIVEQTLEYTNVFVYDFGGA